jgi:drug/metabolite transporter (DMT)-like permease
MHGLLQSRKFWLLILDTVISVATFAVGHYVAPQYSEAALFLIGALQPVFVAIIGGIALEDAAEKRAGVVNRQ